MKNQRAVNRAAERRGAVAYASLNAEVERAADADDRARGRTAGGLIRDNAVAEFIRKNHRNRRLRNHARLGRVVDYAFYGLYVLLVIRLILAVVASGLDTPPAQLIVGLSGPFLALFRGLEPTPVPGQGFTLVLPIVVALASYAIVHGGIKHLLGILERRPGRL